MFKSITAGLIAVFLLFGTIGFGVFSHVCEEDGLDVSYIIPNEEICVDHGHEEHQDTHTEHASDDVCCDEESDADGCCSTTSELVKVHLEFWNKFQVKAILINPEAFSPVWIAEVPMVSEDLECASGKDPPPKTGQELLIDIQQWLI